MSSKKSTKNQSATNIRRCISTTSKLGYDEFIALPAGSLVISHLRNSAAKPIFAEVMATESTDRQSQWQNIKSIPCSDEGLLCDIYGLDSGINLESNLPLSLIFNNQYQLHMTISNMDRGISYTFQEICGDKYWNTLTKKEQSLEYSIMDFLIKYEDLPLDIVGYLSNGNQLYCLK